MENGIVWLSQQQMAVLCKTTKQNISLHIKNIFDKHELDENPTCAKIAQVENEGYAIKY